MNMNMNKKELPGKNIEDVQKLNQVTVLQCIRQNEQICRRQVADMVGLTPGTVTNIVRDLIASGYVVETGYLSGKKGRRAVGLAINRRGFHVLGVRLSRSSIVCRAFNPKAEVILAKTAVIEDFEDAERVLRSMLDLMEEVVEESGVRSSLQAIGVITPGPINFKEGKITHLHGNVHWRDVPIRSLIQDHFGIPTILEHDANAAALAEVLFGEAREASSVLYIAVGRGIGAGLVLDGEVYRGYMGTAGQIGHLSVNLSGPPCECGGTGCLTNYASSRAFLKQMRQELGSDVSLEDLVTLAREGHPVVLEGVKQAAIYTGAAAAGAVNLVNPAVVVFGDEMTEFGSLWFDTAKETLLSRLAPEIRANTKVRLSTFGQEAFLLGTGAIALEYVWQNPIVTPNAVS